METEREVRSGVNPMPFAYLAKLLIEKGLITQAEFMEKLKEKRVHSITPNTIRNTSPSRQATMAWSGSNEAKT